MSESTSSNKGPLVPNWEPFRSELLGFLPPKATQSVSHDTAQEIAKESSPESAAVAAPSEEGSLDDLFDSPEVSTHVEVTRVPSSEAQDPTPPVVTVDPSPQTVVMDQVPSAPAPIFGAPVTEPLLPPPTPVQGMGAQKSGEMVGTRADQAAREQAERKRFEDQLRAREHLYDVVDRVLALVSQEPNLQRMVADFELTRDITRDVAQRVSLQEQVSPLLLGAAIYIPNPHDVPTVFDMAYDELIGISVVGDLWRDPDVDEIMIDAWDRITVERFGRIEETGRRFRSQEHAERVARNLSQIISDRMVSRSNALVTAELPRARIQFVWGNIAQSGLAITIRKFRELLGMDALLAGASLSNEMRDFLADAVRARATILVSGGTGTGKTTMVNALSEFIPDTERVVTIEDAFELSLSNRHVVSMQAKTKASADDTITYSQEDLLVASLRMRPDRIIVGEIREPSAAAVMLQAANTGHEGTMTTIHATNANGALNNRMTLLLMRAGAGFSDEIARQEVAQAFDLVIQINRRAGHRYISEINLVDASLADGGMLRSLPLFTGEVAVAMDPNNPGTPSVTAYFRQVGRVPRTTKLGMKLTDAGDQAGRWLV